MNWESPTIGAFQGLNSFFGQILPILLPILFVLALGFIVLFVGKRAAGAIS